jgi:hypothetical protein
VEVGVIVLLEFFNAEPQFLTLPQGLNQILIGLLKFLDFICLLTCHCHHLGLFLLLLVRLSTLLVLLLLVNFVLNL